MARNGSFGVLIGSLLVVTFLNALPARGQNAFGPLLSKPLVQDRMVARNPRDVKVGGEIGRRIDLTIHNVLFAAQSVDGRSIRCFSALEGPQSNIAAAADPDLLLTEFSDPTGEATYFLTSQPETAVADELCAEQAAKPKAVRKDRIVFLGNSITLHAPLESIGWAGNWGMAASAPEKDYVHLVVQSLSEPTQPASNTPAAKTTAPTIMVENIADFERHYATYPLEEKLRKFLDFKPGLVIVAIGENVPPLTTDESKAQFFNSVSKLLRTLQANENPTIIVRSCFGQYPDKDPILKRAAADVGGIYVDVGALSQNEANYARSERKIAHAGVAGHPGDRGMKAIADAIVDAIRKAEAP